jgi:hypothetical protein
VVNARVGNDNEARLFERARDVVCETAGGEPAGNRLCARVGGVFEDGSVTVRARRDGADVVGILDGGDDTGSEDELFPGLANVDQVDPFCGSTKNQRNQRHGPPIPTVFLIQDNLPSARRL